MQYFFLSILMYLKYLAFRVQKVLSTQFVRLYLVLHLFKKTRIKYKLDFIVF